MLIYWYVEKKSMVIHSQLINCSASEVAAMIDGAMRHGTALDVEGNYTDSHGQSQIGFGITRLLGFRPAPADQADRQGQALPGRQRRPKRIPGAAGGADAPDSLGADGRAVRPDDQVRDREPHPHGIHGGSCAGSCRPTRSTRPTRR